MQGFPPLSTMACCNVCVFSTLPPHAREKMHGSRRTSSMYCPDSSVFRLLSIEYITRNLAYCTDHGNHVSHDLLETSMNWIFQLPAAVSAQICCTRDSKEPLDCQIRLPETLVCILVRLHCSVPHNCIQYMTYMCTQVVSAPQKLAYKLSRQVALAVITLSCCCRTTLTDVRVSVQLTSLSACLAVSSIAMQA